MENFCTHLHQLLLNPLNTRNFKEPYLDVANLQVYGDIVTDILADVEEKLSAMNYLFSVTTLVGGSLTYNELTRLDASKQYRYKYIDTCIINIKSKHLYIK
jgi:hypothetical protein